MPASPWPLEIDGLTLRDPGPGDLEPLLALRNDPHVNRFMLRDHVDPATFRREWSAVPTSDTDFSCVAERDGDVVAMGFLDVVDGMGQTGMPERTQGVIGYIVDPAVAGRGVGSALARGLLTAAFERLGLRRVVASCNADNAASVRVLEKAGMRREQHGIEDSWHAELGWVDGYQYALLAREWRAIPEDVTTVELIGGVEQRELVLVEYDPAWAQRYEQERERIATALGPRAARIEHIGSTAVPGLPAKPIVDILVTVEHIADEAAYLPALLAAGYVLRTREPGHRMVRTPELDVHVHVLQRDAEGVAAYLDLRDRLRASADARRSYTAAKRAALATGVTDMNEYSDAKSDVIAAIRGRASGAAES